MSLDNTNARINLALRDAKTFAQNLPSGVQQESFISLMKNLTDAIALLSREVDHLRERG